MGILAAIPAAIGGLSTLGTIGLASTVGSGVLGAVSAATQAHATAANAKFQAAVDRRNAVMANEAGATQSYSAELKTRSMLGKMMAQEAASGVDVNSPSFTGARASVDEAGLQDASNITTKYANQAWGDNSNAALEEATAENAPTEGALGGLGSLLGAGGQIAANWPKWT